MKEISMKKLTMDKRETLFEITNTLDYEAWKKAARKEAKQMISSTEHKCEFKELAYYDDKIVCSICKYNENVIDFKMDIKNINFIEFWKNHNQYKNNLRVITLHECRICKKIFCHSCLELGYDFAIKFTKFKDLLYKTTLYVACGGCHLEKWKKLAIQRSEAWIDKVDHMCDWGEGIQWVDAADLVRCDICSYNYVGPYDYINDDFYPCVNGYWAKNFKYKFGNSECLIFMCSICNIVICNACREVGYDAAVIYLKSKLEKTKKKFNFYVDRIITLYYGLKCHKDNKLKTLSLKKNVFILTREFLTELPNKELNKFLEN